MKKKKKKLNKLEQTKYANQKLAHEVFLSSLKTKAVIYRNRKKYTRKRKHKNKGE